MRSFILNIGSELTSGTKSNSNSLYLAKSLTILGAPTLFIQSVPDDPFAIASSLKFAIEECEIIVLTGGLGPTVDDVTREAVAACFGLSLNVIEEIEAVLADKIPNPTEGQLRQTQVPDGAAYYLPTLGTAPGFKLELQDRKIYVLPGVPVEMKKMFEDSIEPELKEYIGVSGLKYRTYKFCGLGEAEIEQKLKSIPELARLIVDYSIIAHGIEVQLYMSSDEDGLKVFDERTAALFGDELFTIGDKSLAEIAGDNLINMGINASVIESCTGGLLGKMLTDVPGSSNYFGGGAIVYSNEFKKRLVNVPDEILKKYGAVSSECAEAMAANGLEIFGTDLCLAVTGIAGPAGGTPEKPVGLVWFGLASKNGVETDSIEFRGDRDGVRLRAAQMGLNILRLNAKYY